MVSDLEHLKMDLRQPLYVIRHRFDELVLVIGAVDELQGLEVLRSDKERSEAPVVVELLQANRFERR
ncbi:hypothetical protein AAC387_Pa06g1366 [Persea americana]